MTTNETTNTNTTETTEVKVTKSSEMVRLHNEGRTIRQIADELGTRYQHVYNVLKTKNLLPEVVDQDRTNTKTAKILELHAEGQTTGQIAKTMGITFQHVYNTLKNKGKIVAKK